MTDEALPKRVREYIDRHPDDSAVAVLARFDELEPDDLDAIAAALGSSPPELDTESEPINEQHVSGENNAPEAESPASTPTPDPPRTGAGGGAWADAEWSTPEPDTFTPERLRREQWMGRAGESGKLPFAEWADPDHPEAEPDEDARWKWGIEDNYVDGETIAIAEESHRLDGRVFIQREDDPYAFVDGDDVRCPETGGVHPAFVALLEHLGLTYADVSTSGAGVHANYRGELPDGVKQATFAIDDEPWGANDELPEVEIYDGKHVCVVTGDHVRGTPLEIAEWDDDALRAILDANGQLPTGRPDSASEAFREFDAEDHDPDVTERDEVATDVRDIFTALDRLDARNVAAETIVYKWNDDASTSEGKRAFVPTWGRTANGTANIVDADIWQDTGGGGYGGPHVMAAIACDDINADETTTPRDVTGEDWWRAVEYLRDEGFAIPEYESTPPQDDVWAKSRDVTLDPEVAWRAAEAVTPGELGRACSLDPTADRDGWVCPECGATITVDRAAAIDLGIIADCSDRLGSEEYHQAYEYAREHLEAPLPRYVSRETATGRYDIVTGALKDLTYWHLDEDALNSEVTATGDDVDGAAIRSFDPAWRDSESGASVFVFESGTAYDAHPDHDGAIDALRFAALDAGVLTWEEFTADKYQLTGATFRSAYEAARDYGAPLPRWEGQDAFHTAVLPSAEEIVDGDDDVGNEDRLTAAYDAVGDVYREAARDDERASLLTVLPGLGKTEQVFRQAHDHPALYCAGRKELMADGMTRAAEHGLDAYVLPTFSDNGPMEVVSEAAERAVREVGQQLLRDREALVEAIEDRLADDFELAHPAELEGDNEDDDVDLDRGSCPTANGEHGLEWWLAVHAARGRGYRPQQMHANGAALFGEDLPCTCDEEGTDTTCPYTEAWEIATDPEAPFDVLIGHYTHAHVEGARTYAHRPGGSRTRREPRVVALDEFPGEAYQREFGAEFPDLAAWLAGCLREGVEDRQDLFSAAETLWNDDTVRAWLSPDGTADAHEALADHLEKAVGALRALGIIDWLLEERPEVCQENELTEPLQALRKEHPTWPVGGIRDAYHTIHEIKEDGLTESLPQVRSMLDDLTGCLAPIARSEFDTGEELAEDSLLATIQTGVERTESVADALAGIVETAVSAFGDHTDGARRQLRAAQAALRGGEAGCEALAMHADNGHAHPLAHALLFGVLAAGGNGAETVTTSSFTFGDTDATRLAAVEYGASTVLVDRNHHGAVVNHPPRFQADGDSNPVVGLDATGQPTLWELAIGRDVQARDIHETPRDRREFLRDVYGLQLVQTSPHANSYEGDPSGKNFDDDAELVRSIKQEYGDAVGQSPAVITTKVVEETLEDRLTPHTDALAHYGDVKGSNALAGNRLAALLGCQHYGDQVVERWAALAGEEVARTGYGMALDYNSPVANTALQHMREDQVMQAALRFGRDSGGALVFAHTGALRDDLPVVAEGEVTRTYSENAQAIAEAAADLRHRTGFTSADVRDRVTDIDVSPRTVRRVLAELADAGYLEKTVTGGGRADRYSLEEGAPDAEIDLPEVDSRVTDPGQNTQEVFYTWSVRVSPGAPRAAGHRAVGSATLPAPGDEIHATLTGPPPE